MGEKYTENVTIAPSKMDAWGKLGFAHCFDMFMDIANEHAHRLGIGQSDFNKKGLLWLTVKSKIHFYRRPFVFEEVQVSTWPESLDERRCLRCYRISKEDEVIAEGRTQWAIMDLTKGTVIDMRDVYPDEYNNKEESFSLEDFSILDGDIGGEPFATYKITSNDIDLGKHVNNVAYIRAFQSVFTTEEWKDLKVCDIEIQYKKPCFEGETLEFRNKTEGKTMFVKGSVGEKTAILMKVEMA